MKIDLKILFLTACLGAISGMSSAYTTDDVREAIGGGSDVNQEVMEKARGYLEASRYTDAITYLKAIIAKHPKISLAYYYLGVAYYGNDDPDNAEYNLKKAIELNPYYPEAFYHLALIEYKKQDYKQVLEYLNEVTSLDNTFQVAFYNKGVIYLLLDKPKRAIKEFAYAVYLNPDDNSSLIGLLEASSKLKLITLQKSDIDGNVKIGYTSTEKENMPKEPKKIISKESPETAAERPGFFQRVRSYASTLKHKVMDDHEGKEIKKEPAPAEPKKKEELKEEKKPEGEKKPESPAEEKKPVEKEKIAEPVMVKQEQAKHVEPMPRGKPIEKKIVKKPEPKEIKPPVTATVKEKALEEQFGLTKEKPSAKPITPAVSIAQAKKPEKSEAPLTPDVSVAQVKKPEISKKPPSSGDAYLLAPYGRKKINNLNDEMEIKSEKYIKGALEINFPDGADLKGKTVSLQIKGMMGAEKVKLFLRDKNTKRSPSYYFPEVTRNWKSFSINLNSFSSYIDLSRINQVKIELIPSETLDEDENAVAIKKFEIK